MKILPFTSPEFSSKSPDLEAAVNENRLDYYQCEEDTIRIGIAAFPLDLPKAVAKLPLKPGVQPEAAMPAANKAIAQTVRHSAYEESARAKELAAALHMVDEAHRLGSIRGNDATNS